MQFEKKKKKKLALNSKSLETTDFGSRSLHLNLGRPCSLSCAVFYPVRPRHVHAMEYSSSRRLPHDLEDEEKKKSYWYKYACSACARACMCGFLKPLLVFHPRMFFLGIVRIGVFNIWMNWHLKMATIY